MRVSSQQSEPIHRSQREGTGARQRHGSLRAHASRTSSLLVPLLATLGLATACQAETASEAAPAKATASPAAGASSKTTGGGSALQVIDEFIESQAIDKTNPSWRTKLNKPPQLSFEAGKNYYWAIETNHGQIKVKLLHETAPMHVSSTIYLSRLGFYDGLGFHRVIPGFMAQGGDPLGNGRGGPGYKYDGEFEGGLSHDAPGKLSMANAGPGTDGSQFFLTFVPTQYLDGKHTIFGEVAEGMATIRELEKRGSRSGTTSEPLEMRRTEIIVE